MTRIKSTKAKEPIKIWSKELRNGNISLYLKKYISGTKGKRYEYECLKLYLIPETSKAAKAKNKETLSIAETIKSKRIIEIANGKAGIRKETQPNSMLLTEWVEKYKERKLSTGQSKSNAVTINNTLMHLVKYKGRNILINEVDKSFCKGFILYLSNCSIIERTNSHTDPHKKKVMAKSTAKLYFNTFISILNEAVKEEVIPINPTAMLTSEDKRVINMHYNTRPYLSLEEVERLIKTPCCRIEVKEAFLFACFCGLRYSDIIDLKWEDIKSNDKKWYIEKRQVKTRQKVIIPLSKKAMSWLPKRNKAEYEENVFKLPIPYTINYNLRKWAKAANINKHISFHVSRHTFGTSLITLGADLYTVSKLMGHQNIRTTQIYAEVVNKKKIEAINLFDQKAENS